MDARNFLIIFLMMIIAMLLSFIFITLPLVEKENSESQATTKAGEQEREGQAVEIASTTIPAAATTVSGGTTTVGSSTQTTITSTSNITSQEQASQEIEDINKTVGGYDSILDDIEGAFG